MAWENSKTEEGLDGQSTHVPRGTANEHNYTFVHGIQNWK